MTQPNKYTPVPCHVPLQSGESAFYANYQSNASMRHVISTIRSISKGIKEDSGLRLLMSWADGGLEFIEGRSSLKALNENLAYRITLMGPWQIIEKAGETIELIQVKTKHEIVSSGMDGLSEIDIEEIEYQFEPSEKNISLWQKLVEIAKAYIGTSIKISACSVDEYTNLTDPTSAEVSSVLTEASSGISISILGPDEILADQAQTIERKITDAMQSLGIPVHKVIKVIQGDDEGDTGIFIEP